jgi:argininosuccinate lyase
MVAVKGLPLAYNKDLQETQEPVFSSSDTLLQMLPLVTGWMKAVEFHDERMNEAAQSGFMNAWAAATYLVQQGVPSRIAHERVGKAVQMCLERNCELQDLGLEDLRSLSPHFKEDFYESLKLSSVLAIHDVPGGTAPARVRQAVNITRKRIASLHEEVHAHA